MARNEGHRWFAAYWKRAVKFEPRALKSMRRNAVAGLSGRVLEIGCGNGANFPLYPPGVAELVATDPDPHMLKEARSRAAELGRNITLEQAGAEALPFEDASFDAVVSTLVLCSVPELDKALNEIRRVLKPGGEFRFVEHVRARSGLGAWLQDLNAPWWRWVGAGCNPNRATGEAIRQAGFRMEKLVNRHLAPPIPPLCLTRPAIIGTAVRD
jgi:ubiquinone/menaquinone biosynthesis C-methylase UbiE